MKEQFKLSLKNCDLIQEDEQVNVIERNNKGEEIYSRTLDEVYEKLDDKTNLKIQIGTNGEMSANDVKSVINEFIGKSGINISIENNEEL